MQRIAKFHKVSFEQFKADWADAFPDTSEEDIIHIYEGIRLPARATSGSAGYDFFTPVPLTLAPGESMKVPTGVRAEIDTGWVLQIFPRSSLGFKFRLQLNNTVGIIDSDYFYSDNEGHMLIPGRERLWSWDRAPDLHREFSFLTASPRTTNAVMCATAVLEVRMQGR